MHTIRDMHDMHLINFVDDDALPEGHDFLFVAIPDGGLIFYRESAVSPESLEGSWAAYRAVSKPSEGEPTRASYLELVASR